ncbi:MAG: arylesterase [Alphaproteobacteria bacterium]
MTTLVWAPAGADTILALGDSLTAGYGLSGRDSFPSRLETALRESGHEVRVVNGGVSGDTTAGGLARLDWLMQERPDLVIVSLGANDALRGVDPAVTRRNLDAIITGVKQQNARVMLVGMLAPPNMGSEYGKEFNAIYEELAHDHNVVLYRFFLEGVAGDPALNLADGMHPNAEGVAEIVERILPTVVQALAEEPR